MYMHMLSGLDRLGHNANFTSVFGNRISSREIPERDLMAQRNILCGPGFHRPIRRQVFA
jgi:hypothetical protein